MNLTKASFLLECEKMYDKMSTSLDCHKQDFYTYESTFDKLHTEFGRTLLSESLEQKGEKKKFKQDLGK